MGNFLEGYIALGMTTLLVKIVFDWLKRNRNHNVFLTKNDFYFNIEKLEKKIEKLENKIENINMVLIQKTK